VRTVKSFKSNRRIVPFSVYRKLTPAERKSFGAKITPPMYLTPSDEKPKPSDGPVYYQLHEEKVAAEAAAAPTRRVMGFREWCKHNPAVAKEPKAEKERRD
jgi:hypothetical protein